MGKNSKENRRYSLSKRTNGRCFYCGGIGEEEEHRTPKDRGGSNEESNLVWSCSNCNARKLKGRGKNENLNYLEFLQFEREVSGDKNLLFYGQLLGLKSRISGTCCCFYKLQADILVRKETGEVNEKENVDSFRRICIKCFNSKEYRDEELVYDLSKIPTSGIVYKNYLPRILPRGSSSVDDPLLFD